MIIELCFKASAQVEGRGCPKREPGLFKHVQREWIYSFRLLISGGMERRKFLPFTGKVLSAKLSGNLPSHGDAWMSSTFIHCWGFEHLGLWMILKLCGAGSAAVIWTEKYTRSGGLPQMLHNMEVTQIFSLSLFKFLLKPALLRSVGHFFPSSGFLKGDRENGTFLSQAGKKSPLPSQAFWKSMVLIQ